MFLAAKYSKLLVTLHACYFKHIIGYGNPKSRPQTIQMTAYARVL